MLKADEGLYCSILLSSFLDFVADYDPLRALDTDTAPSTRSMSEEEINALPIHTYKVPVPPK